MNPKSAYWKVLLLLLTGVLLIACDPDVSNNNPYVDIVLQDVPSGSLSRGISDDAQVTWARVTVVDPATGTTIIETNAVPLTKTASGWSGTIELPQAATYRFTGTAGKNDGTSDHVLYVGSIEFSIVDGHNTLDIEMEAPAISSLGPAGGYVFYDKGSYTEGWRYLEVAPVATEWTGKVFGGYGNPMVAGTANELGKGKANTQLIVNAFGDAEPYEAETDYAAKLCNDLEYGGYGDWFLPSFAELFNLDYNFRRVYGLGGISVDYYWSSSDYNDNLAIYRTMNGSASITPDYQNKFDTIRVRAIRSF